MLNLSANLMHFETYWTVFSTSSHVSRQCAALLHTCVICFILRVDFFWSFSSLIGAKCCLYAPLSAIGPASRWGRRTTRTFTTATTRPARSLIAHARWPVGENIICLAFPAPRGGTLMLFQKCQRTSCGRRSAPSSSSSPWTWAGRRCSAAWARTWKYWLMGRYAYKCLAHVQKDVEKEERR